MPGFTFEDHLPNSKFMKLFRCVVTPTPISWGGQGSALNNKQIPLPLASVTALKTGSQFTLGQWELAQNSDGEGATYATVGRPAGSTDGRGRAIDIV